MMKYVGHRSGSLRKLLLFACLLSLPTVASAQNSMPKIFRDLLPKATAKNGANEGQPRRDPTQAQGELKELLNQAEVTPNQTATPAMPPIQLRGKIIGSKGTLALLSIGEKNWITVQPGQSYLLPDYASLELKIVAITAEKVELELLPQQRRLLLP